jgi:hypothetical protein
MSIDGPRARVPDDPAEPRTRPWNDRKMADPPNPAAQLRDRYRGAVLANDVVRDDLWGRDCVGFNVQARLESRARQALVRVQAEIAQLESCLLAVPATAMHVSVDWLLAASSEYDEPKRGLWERHGERWTGELSAITATIMPFTLVYRWLAVTDAAIVAVAEPSEPLQLLRERIRGQLEFPGRSRAMASIVHTTLFRFGEQLSDPERLLLAVEAVDLNASTTVRELIISEELVYPSLSTTVQAHLVLGDSHGRTS